MKRLLFLLPFLWSCTKAPDKIDFGKLPYENLSDYGFFTGELKELTPAERLLEFTPTSPLFTDYAHKKRYVWMPEGSHATLPEDPDAPFDFPEKSILIKHFYYPLQFKNPEGDRRILETRLLIKHQGKWEAYAYLWNEEQTAATLKNIGATVPVSYENEKGEKVSFHYLMPQKTQCRSCHNRDGEMQPLGTKGKQIAAQLPQWKSLGLIDRADIHGAALVNPFDTQQDLTLRARSYLDVNCGHCHSKTGPAATSGLHYNAEEDRPFHLGVMKSPVAAGMGGGGFKFDILPGKSAESIVTHRMNSTHPGVMMPELGRVTVHKEAVDLIAAWIDSL